MPDLIGVFGRFHPVLNHLPIGLLIGLLAIEIVATAIASPLPRRVITGLVWITAISAVVSAISGYVLSQESQYVGETVVTHMRLGFAIAGLSVVLAVVHLRASEGTRGTALTAYRALLVLAVVLLFPAGHLGGTITHGEGFLTGPLRPSGTVEAAGKIAEGAGEAAERRSEYSRDVAPILANRCSACHGTTKRKGGLSLASRDSILAGGEDGPVIVPGKADESEMIRRLRLPLDDEHHMPPETKPQPTAAEIEVLARWIAEGAAFDGAAAAPPEPAPVAKPAPVVVEVRGASPEALSKLREALAHVEPVAKDSTLLWIDFAACAKATGDAEAAALLEPVLEFVGDLGLARSKITDETATLAARMPNLTRLDLRATGVTDAGVAALAGHAKLEELVLPQTQLTDAAVPFLLKIPKLRKVFLWNSGMTIQGIAKLRVSREELVIEAGDAGEARPLETESKVVLTKPVPAPPPAPPAPPGPSTSGAAPAPVNTACPVTGKPVDPAYQVVFQGRVIGFCCRNCPTAFWADPEKYGALAK